jgi:hypothetical protein
MTYAVIQSDSVALTQGQLAAALPVTGRFAPADAARVANESFGLIIDKLEENQAKALQQALRGQGVESEIIVDADLFNMPPVKTTKRFDCLAEHLVVYDSLGRPKSIAWDDVLVVAAGLVSLYETNVSDSTKWETPKGGKAAFVLTGGMSSIVPGLGVLPVPQTTRTVQGHDVPRYVLDVLVRGEPPRYRAEGQELSYAYLGNRRTGEVPGNFAALLRDLMTHAKNAAFNQGFVALRSDFTSAFTYPSRKSFEREMVWLVWRGGRD